MRKAAVLFLVGLSPFLLGWLLSLGMTTIFAQMGAWFYIVVGLAVLTLWMVVSGTFGFKGSKRGMALTMLCINLPALVVLVLLGVQELGQRSGPADPVLLSAPSAPGRYCGHVDRTGVLVLFRRIPAAGAVLLAGLPGQGPSEEINFTKTGKIY